MGSTHTDSSDGQELASIMDSQRRQLFRASAVIEMCRHASASKLEGFDPEQLALALEVSGNLIDGATEALEQIAGRAAVNYAGTMTSG